MAGEQAALETPGRVVARLREAKGWTRYRLAEEARVPWRVVRDLEERGTDSRLSAWRAVMAALGASLGLLDAASPP